MNISMRIFGYKGKTRFLIFYDATLKKCEEKIKLARYLPVRRLCFPMCIRTLSTAILLTTKLQIFAIQA